MSGEGSGDSRPVESKPPSEASSNGEESRAGERAAKAPGYARYFDLPMNDVPGKRHIPRGFAICAVAVVRLIAKCLFRYKVDGKEKLEALAGKTGFVVVGNHTSFLDVVFMFLSIHPPLWPRFIARSTLFEKAGGILGWAFALLGVIPIKRDSADRTCIKRAARFLKDKEPVVIMPEGTRRGKSNIEPTLHGGAALIARMGKAPILPMTVREVDKIKQKGQRIRFPKVTVEFGDPVLLSDFDFLPKEERLEGCTWYAMRECFALSRRCKPSEVDMRALFPESEDFSAAFEEHPIPVHDAAQLAASLEG